MSAQQEESKSPSPSPPPSSSPPDASPSPPYPLVNDSKPEWLPEGPCGLIDNHEDVEKDIWTEPLQGKHWDECRSMLKKHDTNALQEWNDEINTQLLVSSLLAAVAGGFVVEAQKSLSEDPAITSAVILLQIARQLNESIGLPDTGLMAFGGPSPVARTFNSLFYTSLGLSLANVTLGLLCLQWIRGMKYDPPGLLSGRYISFRYGRYLGFEQWGAKGIISALPLLLLGALLTFFAGLLAFASDSDWIASIPLYIVLPSVVAIVLFTTFFPGLVVIINMAFRKGSQFPSVPPFRSLQSWIAMQGFIHIFRAINRVVNFNPFAAFPSLQKCLNWGQLDQLWVSWSTRYIDEALLFPLILSTETIEDMNNISKVMEDLSGGDRTPQLRKMNSILHFAFYSERLPATTQGRIVGHLLTELAGLINVGVSLETVSPVFDLDETISFTFAPIDSTRQLINSLSFLCRTTDTSLESFWNLFWRALTDCMQGASIMEGIPPVLFNDTLGSMQIALENPSTDTQTVFQRGFKIFIQGLAYEVDHPSSWSRSDEGSVLLSAILWHPIWVPAREIVADLPPGEEGTTAAQKCMRTLDRIRQKFPPALAPMEPDDPLLDQLPTQEEPGQPATPPPRHIAIDVVPDQGDERSPSLVAPLHTSVPHEDESEDKAEEDEKEDKVDEHKTDEHKDASETGHPTYPKEESLSTSTSTSTPFALPTPPVDSPISPPLEA